MSPLSDTDGAHGQGNSTGCGRKGYRSEFSGIDALAAEGMSCERCGGAEMIDHGFSIAGVVVRSYVVCHVCGHWIEF